MSVPSLLSDDALAAEFIRRALLQTEPVRPGQSPDDADELLPLLARSQGVWRRIIEQSDASPRLSEWLPSSLGAAWSFSDDLLAGAKARGDAAAVARHQITLQAHDTLMEWCEDWLSETAKDWITLACNDFDAYSGDEDASGAVLELSVAITHARTKSLWAELRVYFPKGEVEPYLWASTLLQDASPTCLGIFAHEYTGRFTWDAKPPPAKAHGGLFRYHPERFRSSRRYTSLLRGIHPHAGVMGARQVAAIRSAVTSEITARRNEVDWREVWRDQGSFWKAWMRDNDTDMAMAWVNFVNAGRQVFELSDGLVERFRRTDADDIPMREIRLPYPYLYLRFGPQPDWEPRPGWFLDGCYVQHHVEHDVLDVIFTAAPANPERADTWHSLREPMIRLSFRTEHFSMTLGHAVDQAVADYRHTILSTKLRVVDNEEKLPHRSQVSSLQRLELEESELTVLADLAQQALGVVASGLCYLTAYSDDITPYWPEGTPEALLEKFRKGTSKQQLKVESELEKMGYSKVHLCGARFMKGVSSDPELHDDKSAMRAHFRRGHWRRQAHGEGRLQRKLIWIMHVMVNAQDGDPEDVQGHIYQVGGEP